MKSLRGCCYSYILNGSGMSHFTSIETSANSSAGMRSEIRFSFHCLGEICYLNDYLYLDWFSNASLAHEQSFLFVLWVLSFQIYDFDHRKIAVIFTRRSSGFNCAAAVAGTLTSSYPLETFREVPFGKALPISSPWPIRLSRNPSLASTRAEKPPASESHSSSDSAKAAFPVPRL